MVKDDDNPANVCCNSSHLLSHHPLALASVHSRLLLQKSVPPLRKGSLLPKGVGTHGQHRSAERQTVVDRRVGRWGGARQPSFSVPPLVRPWEAEICADRRRQTRGP